MILATFLDENRSVSLAQLSREFLKIRPLQKERFQGFYDFAHLPPAKVCDYCCEDVWLTLSLFEKLQQDHSYASIEDAYRQEIQRTFFYAQMEVQGCPYHFQELHRIQTQFSPVWKQRLHSLFNQLQPAIDLQEFLRAPVAITKECLTLMEEEQERSVSDLHSLWTEYQDLIELEKIHQALALFPQEPCTRVSPRYSIRKSDGQLFSALQALFKSPYQEPWELLRLFTAEPKHYFFELSFPELFARLALTFAQDPFYFLWKDQPQLSLDRYLHTERPQLSPEDLQDLKNHCFPRFWKENKSPKDFSPDPHFFPQWQNYAKNLLQQAQQHHFIRSLQGRQRHFHEKTPPLQQLHFFLQLSTQEFLKTLLLHIGSHAFIALHLDHRIFLSIQTLEEGEDLLQKLPSLFPFENFEVPLCIQTSFGKTFADLSPSQKS
jgi:hypothetical protein